MTLDKFVHLKHMAAVRPGLDGRSAQWAVVEIERLRAALKPFAEWARDETRKPTLDDCQRASAVYTNTTRATDEQGGQK